MSFICHWEVCIFQGEKGDIVPTRTKKLIVEQGVRILRDRLCHNCKHLREVSLPNGLAWIGDDAFFNCENLMEIKIGSMVQHIGKRAFASCERLTKVEFACSPSSPHQLRTIEESAFQLCLSLQRIKLPSSVTYVGEQAFAYCYVLKEANLSTTGITEIPDYVFQSCNSLQTVSLPNTLERICRCAFSDCSELVAVVVPLENSQPIKIGKASFEGCRKLAVLVLPGDSAAESGITRFGSFRSFNNPREHSFNECDLLRKCYGEESSGIVAGLIGRFDDSPIHRLCYDHSAVTVEELRHCIAEQQEGESLVDAFGMTPFHVFFSGAEPSMELLDVLLDSLPNHILLKLKDANGRRALDYLITNWTDGNTSLLHRTVQKWMIDPLARWGATSWMEAMQGMVQEILDEDDQEERAALCNEAYSAMEHYENVEATSVLEMALWKCKLKSGRTNNGSKRQALDRDGCRCLSGSNVVIPHVKMFLDIPGASSQDD